MDLLLNILVFIEVRLKELWENENETKIWDLRMRFRGYGLLIKFLVSMREIHRRNESSNFSNSLGKFDAKANALRRKFKFFCRENKRNKALQYKT